VEVGFVGVGLIFTAEVAVTCVCIAIEDEAQLERQHPEKFGMLPLFDLESLALLSQVLQT
jgi:hypothetical protein